MIEQGYFMGTIDHGSKLHSCSSHPAFALLEVAERNNSVGSTDIHTNYEYDNLRRFVFYSKMFPYGIHSDDIIYAHGLIPGAPNSTADVFIEFYPLFGHEKGGEGCIECGEELTGIFETSIDGNWSLTLGSEAFDLGNNSTFSNVPGPSSTLLLSLSLIGLDASRRKSIV